MKYTTYGSNGIPSSSNWAYSSCMWGGADPLLTNHSKERKGWGREGEVKLGVTERRRKREKE